MIYSFPVQTFEHIRVLLSSIWSGNLLYIKPDTINCYMYIICEGEKNRRQLWKEKGLEIFDTMAGWRCLKPKHPDSYTQRFFWLDLWCCITVPAWVLQCRFTYYAGTHGLAAVYVTHYDETSHKCLKIIIFPIC